jgi:hypothetical protein
MPRRDCVIRITLSRGSGPRGYAISGSEQPTLVISLHLVPKIEPSNPPQWRLIISSFRVVANDSFGQSQGE